MTATCLLWVRVRSDYELLFSFLDSFRVDTGRRYWISEQSIEVNTGDMVEDRGHIGTEVKIAFPMSHKTLTSTEEHIQ
ncbi:MAG: hypothetical protein A2Z71_02700 [Chloroflexi bacterium RBG_13_50_21]|nr:MAG: hypothetical protein A2Z71_02700 [Chloroflexi bacterium RBG_13_50_21]OGO62267.1 MAG: hypothetical protein A2029_05250 [Chloroflexi bacterium RBG_19FT_COMBO_47_9]